MSTISSINMGEYYNESINQETILNTEDNDLSCVSVSKNKCFRFKMRALQAFYVWTLLRVMSATSVIFNLQSKIHKYCFEKYIYMYIYILIHNKIKSYTNKHWMFWNRIMYL